MKTPYKKALRALPLPQMMRLLGVPKDSIRENDGAIRCPWSHRHSNQDKNKSCSLYRNMTRIHCFVCEYDYDAIRFAAAWKKTTDQEACNFVLKHAQTESCAGDGEKHPEATRSLVLPPTRELTLEELEAIALRRQVDVDALKSVASLGLLRHAEVCKEPSWLLTDSAGMIAEARMLSGACYPAWGSLSERKAHTIRGSKKSWPVGVALLQTYSYITSIMLLEGAPDLLAAHHFLLRFGFHHVLPVAMLGASAGSQGIDSKALELLHGKHVRIYPHNDESGRDGFLNWCAQLQKAGCTVSRASFAGIMRPDGTPANDLNDLTSLLPGSHQPYRFLFA